MNYFPVGGKKQKFRRVVTNLYYELPAPPFSNTSGCAVVLDNEIHVIVKTKHYKWDGTKWISVSVFPYPLENGGAVVYNNEIHVFGGSSTSYWTNHYKWDGETWTQVDVLPFHFYYSKVVVYNNEIHVIGGQGAIHYKWDGESWTAVGNGAPYNCEGGAICVLNNEIHIMGGNSGKTNHYKWDGNTWTSVATLPFDIENSNAGFAVVIDASIHLLYMWKRAVFDGSSWNTVYPKRYISNYEVTDATSAPHSTYSSQVAVLDDGVHIINYYGRNASSGNYQSYPTHAVENVNLYIPIE